MKDIFYFPVWRLPSLVMEEPTGIRYTFQVGGSACQQKSVEGVVLPLVATGYAGANALGDVLHDVAAELSGLTEETADRIDAVFSDQRHFLELKVDREMMMESSDQWIHMVLLSVKDEYLGGFVLPRRCVLTW